MFPANMVHLLHGLAGIAGSVEIERRAAGAFERAAPTLMLAKK
jgi:hypothetical protein